MGGADDDGGFQFTVFPHCCVQNHGVTLCALQYVLYTPDLLSLVVTITCIRELETRGCHSVCPSNCQLSPYSPTMEPFSLLYKPFLSLHRFCARLQHIILSGKAERRMAGTFTVPSYFIFSIGIL
jgi:hypothetical protein